MYSSLQQGQTIEWDEEIIDSLIMPACLQDSPTVFKAEMMKPRREKWHVTVSIPDSNVRQFRIERELTVKPIWDSLALPSQRVHKTVSYGTSFASYTASSALIGSYTMPGSLDDADFADLPFFEYRPDSIVTSAYRDEFMDSLSSAGATVTDLGTGGIRAVQSFSREGATYTSTAIFDRDYLTISSTKIEDQSRILSEATYQYTPISDLKIATVIRTLNHMRLGPDIMGLYAQEMPERNYTCLDGLQTRTTVILSSIVLP